MKRLVSRQGALALTLALLAAACGGSERPKDDSQGGGVERRCAKREGSVEGYLPRVRRDRCRPNTLEREATLYRGDRLRTLGGGQVEFATSQLAHCKVAQRSSVVIRPSGRIALRHERGLTWCQVRPGGKRVFLQARGRTIEVKGTLIGLETTAGGTLVKVASGEAVVHSQGESEVVLAGTELLAPAKGRLTAPTRFAPDAADTRLMTLLRFNVVTIPLKDVPAFFEAAGADSAAIVGANRETANTVAREAPGVEFTRFTDRQVLETEQAEAMIERQELPVAVAAGFASSALVFADLREEVPLDVPIVFVGDAPLVPEVPASSIAIEDATVVEPDEGLANASFAMTLSVASAEPVTVQYETEDGSASSGTDYEPTSGTVTFAPGETSATIEVAVIGDAESEPDETFIVRVSGPAGASLDNEEAVGAIVDNDPS